MPRASAALGTLNRSMSSGWSPVWRIGAA
jgi:hypothetical protein